MKKSRVNPDTVPSEQSRPGRDDFLKQGQSISISQIVMITLRRVFCKSLQIHSFLGPLQETPDPSKAFALVDTSIQSFFQHRPFDTRSFNFLMQVHIDRSEYDLAKQSYQKMQAFNILPDQVTYIHLLRVAAAEQDLIQSQNLFAKHKSLFGASKQSYTTLLQTYANKRDKKGVLKLMQEIREEGIEPDIVLYTAAVRGFLRCHLIADCWKIYHQVIERKIQINSRFCTRMLEVCAATHDCERAVYLFNKAGIQLTPDLHNTYIKALGRRSDYAQKAIDQFYQMLHNNTLTIKSFTYGLSACATLGDVKQAFNILNLMRQHGHQPNPFTLNEVLRIYATASGIPTLSNQMRSKYVEDVWRVLAMIEGMQALTSYSLNHMLEVYSNMHELKQLEERVLPLYDRHSLDKNQQTYEILLKAYKNVGELGIVMRLWNSARKEGVPVTFKQADVYLETGVKLSDIKQTVQALQIFKGMGRRPRIELLASLSRIENLPIEVQGELMDYKEKFGVVRQKIHHEKLQQKEKKVIERANLKKQHSI